MNNYQLNTNWCLWYHSINDTSWKNSSYKNLYTFENLYDIKSVQDSIQKIHLQNGMFFIMREDIFPTWEDPENREGCCISYKIPSHELLNQWNDLISRVLTEDILKDKDKFNLINGISITPKKEFNIVKLWLREYDENYQDWIKSYEPFYTKDKSLIKKHQLSD
uniref:Uncharacterized protein n=1 Tax=viral metagenome TaxID=1070528 RepID=A0A6C0FFQ9_9ZZZZ|tara:strand:+ start:1191 stop:1682 length:492 start_codon:yes stop_codon:yes gene_type:complete